jgi:group I intron endonuclease
MKIFSVYGVRNKCNGKRYIGQTKQQKPEKRWKGHICDSKRLDKNCILYAAMRKYGIENFEFEVLAQCKTQEDLDECEKTLIKQYNTCVLDKDNWGYNMTRGGQGRPEGLIRKSEREKQKRNNSGEKNPMHGRKQSPETRKLIADKATGRPTKHKGVHHKHTKIIVATFEDCHKEIGVGYNQFAKERGLNPRHLHGVSNGTEKSHKGVIAVELYKYSESLYKRLLDEIS